MKLLTHYAGQAPIYQGIVNWKNHPVSEGMVYAYRDTCYDKNTYPSHLHYHDYYELVVYAEGDVQYICDSRVHVPQRGDAILIPPRCFHRSALMGEATRYRRHVFYLYPTAFDALGHTALAGVLESREQEEILRFSGERGEELFSLLERLRRQGERDEPLSRALMLGYVIELFVLFNRQEARREGNGGFLPDAIRDVQQYLDAHFAELSTVEEVAARFFYSREYVSRLFKQYFDITIADYIRQRRVAEAQRLILSGVSVTEACERVGFGAPSSFIRAFRRVTGETPSDYRRRTFGK